ncbi:unnamed protein product [marine sediment metagenome]|uniref:Uncharacterized protein n=1 Tax=marine sediment metagenome TaxID=412755 RepID=X1AY06_9ZZZZ
MKNQVSLEEIINTIAIMTIGSFIEDGLNMRFKILLAPSKIAQKALTRMGIEYKN